MADMAELVDSEGDSQFSVEVIRKSSPVDSHGKIKSYHHHHGVLFSRTIVIKLP